MDHRGTEAQRDALTERVLGAAIEVHRALGPGLLESAYELCLCHELSLRGIVFLRQVPLPVNYKGCRLDAGYKLDLVVEDRVILEIKAVEQLLRIHEAQLLTYMRLTQIGTGLLLNFHTPRLMDGVKRLKL